MRRPPLTYTQTRVFERLYVLGDSVIEVCARFRISRNAVYRAVYSARRRLAALADVLSAQARELYWPLLRRSGPRRRVFSLSAADQI